MYSDFVMKTLSTPKLKNYYWFRNGFSTAEVARVVALGSAATSTAGETFENTGTAVRQSEVAWLPMQEDTRWIFEKLGKYTAAANERRWNFDLIGMSESMQFTTYRPGKGHYGWHMDVGSRGTHRKISVVTNLSDPDDYEGGELQLWYNATAISLPKTQGATFLFPSYFMHQLTPVTKGCRRSLVLWVSGPPFR